VVILITMWMDYYSLNSVSAMAISGNSRSRDPLPLF
jgi:hypothetical protein